MNLHEEFIKEYKIKVAALPEDIQKAIKLFTELKKLQPTPKGSLIDVSKLDAKKKEYLERPVSTYSQKASFTKEEIAAYKATNQTYTSIGKFDKKSGLWVVIEDFDQTLQKVECPVLALFGAKDSQVDWRKTKKMYEENIGNKQNSNLTIKVFENCNHNIKKCITCAYGEDLSELRWQACDGYYNTMETWLRKNKIID